MKGLLLEEKDGKVSARVQDIPESSLPAGDVLVRVRYSSLNYKDGLAVTHKGKIVRKFPFVPGIDFAGTVEESSSAEWKKGDSVVLTGWGVGEKHWGGYAQLARVQGDWLVRLPQGLSLEESMGIGTAGFTAMLCVMALEEHGVTREGPPVLVTGAAGGVGSVAVALLARAGFKVAAVTGRKEHAGLLQELGASEILGRDEVKPPSAAPLQSQRWAGAVDVVGGEMLAQLFPQIQYGGAVAACGLAGGNAFSTTVFPFILRAVSLLGVDSVACPRPRREAAWKRLARDLPREAFARLTHRAPLEQVPELSQKILEGKVMGRVVVTLPE